MTNKKSDREVIKILLPYLSGNEGGEVQTYKTSDGLTGYKFPCLSVVVSMTVKRLETTKWQNYFLNVFRVDIAVTISSVVEGKEGLNVKAE